jgi:hypothetical protein
VDVEFEAVLAADEDAVGDVKLGAAVVEEGGGVVQSRVEVQGCLGTGAANRRALMGASA